MKITQIDNDKVFSMLPDETLYMVQTSERAVAKGKTLPYISTRLVMSLTTREVYEGVSNPDIAFIKLEES